MDSVFNVLLWCLQILTAGVLLFQTCFDLFYTIAEKRLKHQPPRARIPHQLPEASLSIPIQETQSQDTFFV
jgi:hypothetical protein